MECEKCGLTKGWCVCKPGAQERAVSELSDELYDLEDLNDVKEFIRKLYGYMKVSRHDGTDYEGRLKCLNALKEIVQGDYGVFIDTEPFEPPTVGNDVI